MALLRWSWSLLVIGVLCGGHSSITGVAAEEKNDTKDVDISRKHVAVWFDYAVRYYDHEADNAYSKNDLRVMVNVVASRFSKIAIDVAPLLEKLPPEKNAHSRLLIPEVVAEHNLEENITARESKVSIRPPMEVMVTFDVAKIARTKQLTSFDVAKYMADKANEIYPGTVKTLMMYTGFTLFSSYFNIKDTVQQLKVARMKIEGTYENDTSTNSSPTSASSKFKYDLAVFMDLKDCGHFKGSLGEKAKEFVPHVEIIVTLLRPNYHQMSFTPDIIHKMYVTKFDDCERKLKEEKSSIRVIPAVLWTDRKGSASSRMAQFWPMMSDWAKQRNQQVIMFEAFETPNGHLLADQGWWRLKDKAEHEIKDGSFIEKIKEGSSKGDRSSDGPLSGEDSDESDSESSPKSSRRSPIVSTNSLSAPPSPQHNEALYTVVILLTVICFLLVAVNLGLVYGFRSLVITRPVNPPSNSSLYTRNSHRTLNGGASTSTTTLVTRRPPPANSNDPLLTSPSYFEGTTEDSGGDDEGSINGSILEIRDTTPIVAVTYKK